MIESDGRMTVTSLKENQWLSLRSVASPEDEINGYVYSHETRCQGNIIAVLPVAYDYTTHQYKYLIRSEVTPCWGLEPQYSALTGGWEGGPYVDDAVRELEEEAGYRVDHKEMIDLGTCFGTKSTDTTFRLFAINVFGKPQYEALGDGSKQDSEGTVQWMTFEDILDNVSDPIVFMLVSRFQRETLGAILKEI